MSDERDEQGSGPADVPVPTDVPVTADVLPSEAPPPPPPEARTVFMAPRGDGSQPPAPPPPLPPPPPPGDEPAARAAGQIRVGDVLNHIFEVKRFIGRGGMGEVFEGTNVNTEERVAIKVMLPALAADPDVIAMFRKEARTLTRLNHEGLVNYRVLAQEPNLNVLYIVTEYIDGANLVDVLGTLKPTPAQMIGMLRRLAAGLRAAHALGAIHRDMSPDNVLLEGGDAGRAKVIDFGIAKDLDPGSKTIVGEGFAGKLSYVAPEQLGDFDREIGPWTDVYSLGLVMLALALGRPVQMGGSLVDAVDKRRAGVDLSGVPDELRGVLAAMLRPDPRERLRSMDAVLGELDARPASPPSVEPVVPAQRRLSPALLAAGAAGALALAGGAWFALGGGDSGKPVERNATAAASAAVADPVRVARAAIDAALPSVTCTWLNVTDVRREGAGVAVTFNGVAGDPAAAQNDISRALAAQRITRADLDFDNVSPITQSGCAALNAYLQVRSTDRQRLSVPQVRFEMREQPAGSAYAGKVAANAIVNVNVGDPNSDFALIGLEPSGAIDPLIIGRAAFQQQVTQSKDGKPITDLGGDRYRLQLDLDHAGWSGILLVTGKGPFEPALVMPGFGARGPDWLNRFVSTAAERGWKTDMVWFQTVEDGGARAATAGR